MKKLVIMFVLILLFVGCSNNKIESIKNEITTPSIENIESIKTIVPAYFYPGKEWDKLIKLSKDNTIYAVANPSNGAGKFDKKYDKTFKKFKESSGKLLGYVYTSYGKRSLDDIKNDIDTWYTLYKPDGIFLDEQASSKEYISYYRILSMYIKSKYDGIIIGNTGTIPDEDYIKINDITCIHENSTSNIKDNDLLGKYDKDKFYIIIHSTEKKINNDNVGWIYTTPDIMPNPYDTLSL